MERTEGGGRNDGDDARQSSNRLFNPATHGCRAFHGNRTRPPGRHRSGLAQVASLVVHAELRCHRCREYGSHRQPFAGLPFVRGPDRSPGPEKKTTFRSRCSRSVSITNASKSIRGTIRTTRPNVEYAFLCEVLGRRREAVFRLHSLQRSPSSSRSSHAARRGSSTSCLFSSRVKPGSRHGRAVDRSTPTGGPGP